MWIKLKNSQLTSLREIVKELSQALQHIKGLATIPVQNFSILGEPYSFVLLNLYGWLNKPSRTKTATKIIHRLAYEATNDCS